MGIIRGLLLSYLFIAKLFFVDAQTLQNTVELDNKLFIKHIVKAGESLNKIAKLYNITVSDILSLNDINKRLYYNQVLLIPVLDQESNVEHKDYKLIKTNKEINVALLMPYYLIKNDTMFNDFTDTSKISSIYYNSSETALSFHLGVKLALDSLRKKGEKIIMHTFDTNQDSAKVYSLVSSGVLNNMDIIIGPLYTKNFNILCRRYGNHKDKILINPLSKLTSSVKKYKSVYQIYPDVKDQVLIIKNRILSKYKGKRVMLLYKDDEEKIALSVQSLFRRDKKNIHLYNIESSHVDSLRNIFTDYQIVIIPSSNRSFVSGLLGSIGIMDSTSIIFGLNAWERYDNLDIDNLMELDVHIPVYNFFNYNKKHDRSFLRLFEQEYNTNQGKYTFIAYNIIMHFCSDFRAFNFRRINNGGKINIRSPLYRYVDYELTKVN